MALKVAFLVISALACSAASAQVYRCPDKATGRVIYSDAPCADGRQIVKQLSDEERALSAERASIARERAQLERERAALRQQRDSSRQQPQQSQDSSRPAIDQFACQKAKRELSIASNLQSESPAGKRRRMNAAIIEVNASCGTRTELIQEPVKIYVEPRRW